MMSDAYKTLIWRQAIIVTKVLLMWTESQSHVLWIKKQ